MIKEVRRRMEVKKGRDMERRNEKKKERTCE